MSQFRLALTALAVGLLVLAATSPDAPVRAADGKRLALVVGNGGYAHSTPLANPANDAADMTAALKQIGFEVISGTDLDKRGFDGRLRDFARALPKAEVALFFYAGHGLQISGRNYLVPVDAQLQSERDLDFEGVSLDFVLKQMEIEREGKTNIVLLDACRDNPLARNLARTMGTRSASIGQGLAQVQTGVGTFIAYSTQPGNVALDGQGRNSPFTTALAKAVVVPGRTITSVMIEVRNDVLAATNGRQVPWDHSALTGEFYLHQASAPGGLKQATPTGPDTTQQRLRQLEEELKKKSSPQQTADMVELAQLRERVRQMEEANKADQKRIFDIQMNTARSNEPGAAAKTSFEIGGIQMQIGRRVQELRAARERIGALEDQLGLKANEKAPKN